MSEDIQKKDYTEPKQFNKTIEGKAVVKEKGFFAKLGEVFLSEDAKNVKSYIFKDVVIPAIKDTIVNIIQTGTEMLFYGETRASNISKRARGGNNTYVSYSSYYERGPKDRPTVRPNSDRVRSDSREFIYPTRGQAEDALHLLRECLEDYQVATVADLCRISNTETDTLMSDQWTDNDWGWYDLSGAYVKRIFGNQFLLVLPKPVYIR